ncbi:transcriptional repressor proteinral negative regulator of transcription subunit 4 [Xanthoria calcicola]
MANRVQQDAFMDDSDDSCPLCVEEFDLSDKNFRPCPCGYQVCQFCYNNIKNNMNGLCPACRRPYDEKNIEWKIISPEEQKADIALQARKKAMARQKESERRQVESLNRKHLSGIRVVQKNLVYVVGLNPKSREEDLLQTLRGDQYFGQYGKIIKIVVSKAKVNAGGNSSIGVYVTFARKEDAASCIAAVDGSQNGDRTLRAQYGTTKYCSAYLRNETCNNRECMFLHEQGEDDDSFSRQDLSSINAVSTQRPAARASSSTSTAKPAPTPPQPQPPPQHAPQVVSAASHSMARQGSRDEPMSRSDSGDGSALPSSASWAAKNAQSESRRSSKPSSMSASSPQVANTHPVPGHSPTTHPPASVSLQEQAQRQPLDQSTTSPTRNPPQVSQPKQPHPLDRLLQKVSSASFKFTFDRSLYSEEDLRHMDATPLLFDPNGGLVRYRMEKRERERAKKEEEEQASKVLGALDTTEEDGPPASGSLQLGGEPETDDGRQSVGRQSSEPRSAIQAPFPSTANGLPFGNSFFGNSQTVNARSLTPQQQQQLLMLRGTNQQSPVNTHGQHGFTGQTSQHHHQQSNPFQNQSQSFGIPGHTRHASRFTFANDTASASTAVKPNANPSLLAQQSAMMPPSQNKHFQNQAMQPSGVHKGHFYSGVQGPPPGLKSSGTPPISGGGMFGQGHGFTQPVGGSSGLGGIGSTKNSNEQMMQNLLRNRGDTLNGPGPDVGKLDLADPSILQARMHHGGIGQGQLGLQGQGGYNTNSMMYGGGYGSRW